MYKLISESTLALYNSVHANDNWLSKYENGKSWSLQARGIIDAYLASHNHQCILYGSKSVEYLIRSRRNNPMFRIRTNDYDVFSSRPKQQVRELYELFKRETSYVWNMKCVFARNRGTCTLFVNEIKLVDFTYMHQRALDALPTVDYAIANGRIRCLPHLLSMSACMAVLADVEAIYMIPKMTERLQLLSAEYPFKCAIDVASNDSVNLFDSRELCKLVGDISSMLDKRIKLGASTRVPMYTNLIRPKLDILNGEVPKLEYIQLGDSHDANARVHEHINESTGLPSFYRYVDLSNSKYFYTGSIAAYAYISAFGDNIKIDDQTVQRQQLLSCIFDKEIEIYVEDINVIMSCIIDGLKERVKHIECSNITPNQYSCMFGKAVRMRLVDMDVSVCLYELTQERFVELVNVSLPHQRINGMRCSCYMFLMAHILLKMSLHGRSKYERYSTLISILSIISSKKSSLNTFRPPHLSNSPTTVGNKRSLMRSNESFDGDAGGDDLNDADNNDEHAKKGQSEKTTKSLRVTVNYDLID